MSDLQPGAIFDFKTNLSLCALFQNRRDKSLWFTIPVDHACMLVGGDDVGVTNAEERVIEVARGGHGIWVHEEYFQALDYAYTYESSVVEDIHARLRGVFSELIEEDPEYQANRIRIGSILQKLEEKLHLNSN